MFHHAYFQLSYITVDRCVLSYCICQSSHSNRYASLSL